MADGRRPDPEAVAELTRAVANRVLGRIAEAQDQRVLLQAVVENIPVGLLVVAEDGAPLLVNAEGLRILRREDIDEFAGWRDTEGYHLDGRPVDPGDWPLSRTLGAGEVVRAETYEVVVEGRHVMLEMSTAPVVSPSGVTTGALAVFRDVTVQQRTERAEREFVTNAAHELQSPLAAIVSAIEVLQSGAKDGPQRDVFLGHIEREAERLARLVRALLVLARSQIGLEAPRDELVALCPLLSDVGAGLRLATSVELEVDCPESLAVVSNRELVEQAVVNLAENAAKQTRSGRVVLAARQLDAGNVEISIADTGPGISAMERPKVFERFYRSDPNDGPGFGLGLAIVRSVAAAIGGELELDSTVGAGTIVRLRLPRAASMVTS